MPHFHLFQITIDVTPPHTGVVHDGTIGTADVDFQQSLVLKAHWSGFFDRESGVLLYLYTFDTQCRTKDFMKLDSGNANVRLQ